MIDCIGLRPCAVVTFGLLLTHRTEEATAMITPRTVGSVVTLLVATLMLVTGCADSGLEYIPSGGTYSMQEAQTLASNTSVDAVKDTKTSDAPALRSKRLATLRAEGPDGTALADALTSTSQATRIRPTTIRECARRRRCGVLIIEAWGDKGGTLTHRRMWLLDRQDLQVVGSSSFR